MRTATTISVIGHAAVLLWSVWSFAAHPLASLPTDLLPVDVVSAAEFSKITQGVKEAPKTEASKPLVEKVAEAKPVEDPAAKLAEKEVKAARDQPPAPEAKPVESKPEEAKPHKKAAAEQKPTDAKPDPIAEALEKSPVKAEPKKPEKPQADKTPTPPRKPAPPAPKFDPKRVEALLDKRDPARLAAAGDALSPRASLGLPSGRDAQLSMSELDALRARLARLWTPPAGAPDPRELIVLVRIRLKPDGTLAAPPEVLNSGSSLHYIAARDSAKRAVIRGQPYDMLRPEHYEQWKDIEITFDPRDMLRG
jgi:outer membrane biosynthesis protein TonB